ncbi:nonribosomal peptide synthetase 12 [Rickenella mellea]|uniref:Nonribosomal peptide synthetase 12 n=1 Tax=Rickenella mellea TaxID=50990 RepID=A0A4Y7Q3M0_9AGAM|nr:nonribosomal peptide synthetase 12 [Rickenella mellea]
MGDHFLDYGTLSCLSAEDRVKFLQYGFGAVEAAPFGCVHHAFEHHAKLYPSSVAVEHLGHKITYAELDRKANCLAHQLRSLGVQPGSRICLLVQRSIAMVIGIVAILKAGGQYVPLDGGIVTQSTLEYVIEDSGAAVVVVLQEYAERVAHMSGLITVVLERYIEATCNLAGMGCAKPLDLSTPDDGVYVIYTSGTTGKPKGVDVLHSNVTNLVCLAPGNVGMAPGRRVAQLLNVAFDMCAWEVLGSLCNGCTLCIRGKTAKEWSTVMKSVDIVISTPTILGQHDPANYPNIKFVATAGEVCPQPLADRWGQSAQYFNSCGPTEITIVNTVQPHTPGETITIGRPTANNNVYILDDGMRPVPIGEMGTMWAGGAGVTRGYVNNPAKTSERYKLDPFLNNGSIMFNTGDLGRWRPDGKLEHLGRIDDQVKIKGFRVELDGVSAAMETCLGVDVAAALLIDNELWGFFTPDTVAIDDVKVATAKIQPYYAVPSHYRGLPSFPKTSNGKTDKRVLRQIALGDASGSSSSLVLQPSRKANGVSSTTQIPESKKVVRIDIISVALAAESAATLVPPLPIYQRYSSNHTTMSFPSVSFPSRPQSVKSDNSSAHASDETVEVSSAVEKGSLSWEGYEDEKVPNKTQRKPVRNLRHIVFTLYRRLFGVVFCVNVAILIATLVRGNMNAEYLGKIVVANLFCAVLMRQDYVVNAFFTVFCAVPTSWPLSIRRICARVYHIGGLHSGCAISGVMWLVLFTIQATIEMAHGGKTSVATVAVTYCILFLLIGIVLFAYPKVRSVAHDRFERTHRFLGWSATLLVWCQVVLLINDYRPLGQTLGQALVTSPVFWLVCIMTSSIILPWVRLRKVPVRAEVLSSHAVRLYFDYVTPIPGTFTRISESPLLEWHGFATVPEPGMKGYSLVVSKAGDWTTKQIQNPPKELWVRGIPTCGVLRIVPLFKRLVFVATGSGIGPCAPCILEQRVPIRLLWTSPNVRQTFGDKLVDSILAASPNAVVYDTRVHGKPDMIKLTHRLVREFNAEAVCVISNQKLTQKIVYGMMSRGIPAFGAIWDS